MYQKIKYSFPFLVFVLIIWLSLPSCQHEPLFDEPIVNPIDTMLNPIDTMTIDTMPIDTNIVDTTIIQMPCDSNVIYFEQDVLPILVSNCAFSGCHNAASAQDGVILESYETVMQTADVEPFNLNDSEIWEVLVDNDLDDRMPPDPTPALSQTQISTITTWILQGALNLECDENIGGCDTGEVSFSAFVKPIIESHCQGCHSGNTPSGGINLTTYSNIQVYANNGRLYGAIAHQPGFEAMPQGGAKLEDCTIEKIKSWIDAGAQNN